MAQIIVFLPLLGFLFCFLFGNIFGFRASQIITTSFLFISAILSWFLFFSYLGEREKSLATQNEFAKRALEAAIQAQDVEKQVAAQQQLAKLELERERLRASERRLEREKTEPKEEINVDQYLQQQAPQQQQQQQPTATPEAEDWAENNKWFNKDRVMTASAMVIHQDLAEEGFDLNSEDYYNEISKRIRKEFPHKFEGSAKPTQRVASAVRTNTATGRRTVKLTPSQVAIAKKLGVPLEEYAKHVKEA